MIRYFFRALAARIGTYRTLTLLTVLGTALGVASVFSIQVLNQNSLGAFEGSLRALSGDADLTVLGATETFPEERYLDVLRTPGVAGAWPIHRVRVALLDEAHDIATPPLVEIIGVDLLAPSGTPVPTRDVDPTRAILEPGWVAISPPFADARALEMGDSIRVGSGTREVTLTVGGVVDFQAVSPLASPDLLVMDIAGAQTRLGIPGRLHEVQVVAGDDVDVAVLRDRLQDALGPEVRVVTPAAREREASRILSAFRLNLTALSLISVVVGGFLIFAAVRDALLRRRGEFGLLRSLGATREQVLGLVLGEAILLGLVGTALGIALGRVAAEVNLARVGQTLSTIYLIDAMHAVVIAPRTYLAGLAVGLGGALVAAVGPSIEVSRRDARRLLSAFTVDDAAARTVRIRLLAALGIAVAAAVALVSGITAWRGAGFALALAAIGAITLATPAVVRGVARLAPVHGFGIGVSFRNLSLRVSSTSVAVAALAVATSMLVGVTVMIGSFRETLVAWLDQTLEADVYVSSASWTRASEASTLDPDTLARLRALPGVRGMDTLRQLQVRVGDRTILLGGVEGDVGLTDRRLRLVDGEAADILAVFEPGARSVIVSEPLYRKTGLGRGDALPVSTPEGVVSLPIRGVYADYASEGGAAFVSRATLDGLFGPGPPQNAALFVAEGIDPETLVDTIVRELDDLPITAHSNRRLREESLDVFDETFAVTRILQLMALLVAAIGIALTLVVLARERLSELALFRALGATRGQVFGVFVGEGLGMGVLGLVLGGAAGVLLALDLVYVVNRAYFGWTLQLHWPVPDLLVQGAIVLAASGLAALYPAYLAARTSAAELVREDV